MDSLRVATRVRLAVIPSVDKALCDLGTFDFVALHLYSAGVRHSSAVAELLNLIERLEEIHTEVQGMISSPHLTTILLYDVLRQWSQYLNRCVAASDSEVVEAPGASVPFSLEPIMVEMEGSRYIGPILLISLTELVAGTQSAGEGSPKSGGCSSNGSGDGVSSGSVSRNNKPSPKVDATGGPCTSAGKL